MKVIILGDKYQKGFKSQGCSGLLKINGSTNILQNQYGSIINNFDDDVDFLYIYGFDQKRLSYFIGTNNFPRAKFIYNTNHDKYNEGGSLSLIKNELDTDILILSGYTILGRSFFKNFNRGVSQLFIDTKNSTKLGCIISNDCVENIFYDLENKIHGVFYISSKDIDTFSNLITIKNQNAFLFEIINKCISKGCNFAANPISSKAIKYYQQDIKVKLYDKH